MVETDGDLTAYVHQLEVRFDSDEEFNVDGEDDTDFDDAFDIDFFSDLFDGTEEDDDDEDFEEDENDEDIFDEDDLPSGESLAQDFERYLRDHKPNDDGPTAT